MFEGERRCSAVPHPTTPYPVWVYPWIPRVRDPSYGIAALLFAAVAAAEEVALG